MRPLEGIKVVELGVWAAVPGAATIMAEWGASVIKVESPDGGDPVRGLLKFGTWLAPSKYNFIWEFYNRNKRSLAINLKEEAGRQVFYRLIEDTDVFVTSLRDSNRKSLAIDYDQLSRINPKLVYGIVSGLGQEGPDAQRPGYDYSSFWARSGIMSSLAQPGEAPPLLRTAMGDNTTSMNLVGAVLAGLVGRQQSGRGQKVAVSLLHTGTWVAGAILQEALSTGAAVNQVARDRVGNPLFNAYPTKDGWVVFIMLQADQFWKQFCDAVARPDLAVDPRFSSIQLRATNCSMLVHVIDDILRQRTTAEWAGQFDAHDLHWGAALTLDEALADPQAEANHHFVDFEHPSHGHIRLVAAPAQFSGSPPEIRLAAPELGQHTEEILLELAYDWPDIERFKDTKVIP